MRWKLFGTRPPLLTFPPAAASMSLTSGGQLAESAPSTEILFRVRCCTVAWSNQRSVLRWVDQ